ncbi:kazal-like serine protease inhibitor domain and phox-like domain-containing protein [Phytophthora cinnamomi]|uniref:kazal-like serine protease inhibitor domain and phox-like domain-containing protein n=1 Tax=Phytophthora cinnamomi TaxID=4785 RepID=UPI00355A833C|nr:kazal-like serine protease inhibitor domain and phox-like domain-containing protein [Phytophthora cinnamomi]
MEGGRETKRVKLVHTAATNASSAPVQRRLRKMSEEFQPSSFRFLVQARLLCVGLAVVYRVSLSLTVTSTCISATGATTTNGGHTTQFAWVIAMSQTKFRGFYAQVATILHHPSVTQHLTPTSIQQQQQHHHRQDEDHEIVVEWKPFEVFLQILADVFRRYEHLQYAAFSIQADVTTMNIGKVELEGFLSECWRALEVIVPALVVEPYLPAPLGREVLCIYLLMRDFLSLPENVLDANCTYANAILSLEDVEDLLPTHSEHSCSICLEPLVSSETKGLELPESDRDNSYSCHSSGSNGSSSDSDDTGTPDANSANFSVKLPCAHVYHENCIMSWLRHNPSCPECRAPVGVGL